MKKITESELYKRVTSLREKLVLEAAVGKDLGNGFQSATIQTMGGEYPAVLDTESNTYFFLNQRKDGSPIARTLAPYLRSKDGEISGTMKIGPLTTAAMGKAGIATEPATTPVVPPTPIAGTALPPLAPEINPTDQRLANKTQTTPAAVTSPVVPPAPITGTDLPPLAPEINPTDQRLANKTQTTPAASAPEFSPAASDAAFNAARARMAEPKADSAAKVSTPAAVPVDQRDGPTGQALARMGISKKDRLDQAFVNSRLGPGYTAGSAASNLALLKTKPAVDTIDVPKRFDKAPANVPDSTGKYFNVPSNPTPRPMNVRPLPGQPPTKNESVSYADDQTLARIVSLGRR